eukprot:TRINITY_DN3534_c0_g3_i1.p1 TRINITY_DN3534_c0_g3~~TRINITY_DN3534_c0_g3_i1.p1  ORF type:complete len:468 (+),score=84.85 TRINITY_DN3534_c0_g3_i1:182-1585(+)
MRLSVELTDSRNHRVTKSVLNVCDLAGSEKWNKEEQMTVEHLAEMRTINLSLTTLGKVVSALASRKPYVPYRDSKLTRLLQDSLGKNSSTYLIATISPLKAFFDETVNTLKFADRAKQVVSKVRVNLSSPETPIVDQLKREICSLHEILAQVASGNTEMTQLHAQILALKEENAKLKERHMPTTYVERLVEENSRLKQSLESTSMPQKQTSTPPNEQVPEEETEEKSEKSEKTEKSEEKSENPEEELVPGDSIVYDLRRKDCISMKISIKMGSFQVYGQSCDEKAKERSESCVKSSAREEKSGDEDDSNSLKAGKCLSAKLSLPAESTFQGGGPIEHSSSVSPQKFKTFKLPVVAESSVKYECKQVEGASSTEWSYFGEPPALSAREKSKSALLALKSVTVSARSSSRVTPREGLSSPRPDQKTKSNHETMKAKYKQLGRGGRPGSSTSYNCVSVGETPNTRPFFRK